MKIEAQDFARSAAFYTTLGMKAAGFADVPAPRAMGAMASVMLLRDPDGNQVELLGPLPAK
ncbi:MAG: hypothetical protein QM676_05435 [Novosphingobium sp.]